MWVKIDKLCGWIIPETRRAFYYIPGKTVDLPVPWAAKFLAEGNARPAPDPDEPLFDPPCIPPSLGDAPLTVACVWRSGGVYDRGAYVERLARAVARHLTIPHRFVCLTDHPEPLAGVETIPLIMPWRGYWAKVELYRPGLFAGPVLYLDLDTVISGSLDELASIEAPLVVAWDMMRGWLNSSLMLWRVDLSCVIDAMIGDTAAILHRYDEDGPTWGDQGLLQDVLTKERIPWRWFQSACPHRVLWMPPGLRGHPPPAGTAVELWYGEPKQAETGGAWLDEHWR